MSDKGSLPRRLIYASLTIIALACSAIVFLSYKRLEGLKTIEKDLTQIAGQEVSQKTTALQTELKNLAMSPSMTEAFEALSSGYDAYIPDHLRDTYVALNPYLGDDLGLLEDPRDGSQYSQAHARYHAWLRNTALRSGYKDLLLVRADGHIIYSVRKGRAFATKLPKVDNESGLRELSQTVRAVNSDPVARSAEISPTHVSLAGERVFYAATPLRANSPQVVGTLVVEHPALTPTTSRQATEEVEQARAAAWVEGAVSLAGFGMMSLLLLGISIQVQAPSAVGTEEDLPLPLVPIEPTAEERSDSTRPGSHRSGTRQVVHSSGRLERKQPQQKAERG